MKNWENLTKTPVQMSYYSAKKMETFYLQRSLTVFMIQSKREAGGEKSPKERIDEEI